MTVAEIKNILDSLPGNPNDILVEIDTEHDFAFDLWFSKGASASESAQMLKLGWTPIGKDQFYKECWPQDEEEDDS